MVLVIVRLHLAGLARGAGLADGETGRAALLQIPGDRLDQVRQQGGPPRCQVVLVVSSALQKEISFLERRVRARFQSMAISPVMMMGRGSGIGASGRDNLNFI